MILSILSSRQTALSGSLACFSDYFLSVFQESFFSQFDAHCSKPFASTPLSLLSDRFLFFIFYTPSLRNHIIWRSPKFPVFHSSLFSWLSTKISPLYSCSNISYIYSFLLNGCQNMQLFPPEYCEDPPPYLSKGGGERIYFQILNSS